MASNQTKNYAETSRIAWAKETFWLGPKGVYLCFRDLHRGESGVYTDTKNSVK